jgi:hypothetical protein
VAGYGDVDQAIKRSLMQSRCFRCGGVLLVYHLCPCCLQLVHPGCECGSRLAQQGALLVEGAGMSMAFQREEKMRWQ